MRHLDCGQRFGQRADLIDLDVAKPSPNRTWQTQRQPGSAMKQINLEAYAG
jgi:hypothetical protein